MTKVRLLYPIKAPFLGFIVIRVFNSGSNQVFRRGL